MTACSQDAVKLGLTLSTAVEKEAAKAGKKVLTPEEEAARKAELLKVRETQLLHGTELIFHLSQTYGYIAEDEEEQAEQEKKQAESDAPFVDPRTLSKKARKKAEAGLGSSLRLSFPLQANPLAFHRYLHAAEYERFQRQERRGAEAERRLDEGRREAGQGQE